MGCGRAFAPFGRRSPPRASRRTGAQAVPRECPATGRIRAPGSSVLSLRARAGRLPAPARRLDARVGRAYDRTGHWEAAMRSSPLPLARGLAFVALIATVSLRLAPQAGAEDRSQPTVG